MKDESYTNIQAASLICEKENQIATLINQIDKLEKENSDIKNALFYKDLNKKAATDKESDKWMIKYLKLKEMYKQLNDRANQKQTQLNLTIQRLNATLQKVHVQFNGWQHFLTQLQNNMIADPSTNYKSPAYKNKGKQTKSKNENEDTDKESFDMEPSTDAGTTEKKQIKRRQFIMVQETIKNIFIKDSRLNDQLNTDRQSFRASSKFECKDCALLHEVIRQAQEMIGIQASSLKQFNLQFIKEPTSFDQQSFDLSSANKSITVSINPQNYLSVHKLLATNSKLSLTEKERLAFACMNPSKLQSSEESQNEIPDNDKAILIESNRSINIAHSNIHDNLLGLENISSIKNLESGNKHEGFNDTFSPPQAPMSKPKESITCIKKELVFDDTGKFARNKSELKNIPETKPTEPNERLHSKENIPIKRKPKRCSCMGISCNPVKRIERI